MYQRFGSCSPKSVNVSAFLFIFTKKCECISVFAHCHPKVRMYQRFCSFSPKSANVSAFLLIFTKKCECISVFAHRKLKSANVSAFLLFFLTPVRRVYFFSVSFYSFLSFLLPLPLHSIKHKHSINHSIKSIKHIISDIVSR